MWPSAKHAIAGAMHKHFPRTWLAFSIARRDRHFEPELWLVPALCDRAHIAIDVGANMGIFAYYMCRYAAAVVAFEPNPDLWPELRRRLPRRVRLEGVALSSRPGSAPLRYVEDNTGVATVEARNRLGMIDDPATIRTRMVELRTLDSFRFDRVSFIKIDVEGHEEAVIEGALETLRRNRPALLIEAEDRHNPGAPRRLSERLSGLGYRGHYLSDGRLQPVVWAGECWGRPANLPAEGKPYVNNYLFLPVERPALLDRLRSLDRGARAGS